VYRLKEGDDKLKGGDVDEQIVYSIIKDSGNKGIWSRDLRFKSNLNMTLLNKVLKSMEGKKLIKSVKSVSASRKKVYMLFDIEPDRSVTGGAWYSHDQDFEVEFVDVLNKQCLRFLTEQAEIAKKHSDPYLRMRASFATSDKIWEYIKNSNISKVSLSVGDIESILETLVFDGCVEKSVEAVGQMGSGDGISHVKAYRAILEPLVKSTGLMQMPCGVCPVISDCHEGNYISPTKCVYFKEWLENGW
jgi:DNA-directed RNA polymerase III subunit RPC6